MKSCSSDAALLVLAVVWTVLNFGTLAIVEGDSASWRNEYGVAPRIVAACRPLSAPTRFGSRIHARLVRPPWSTTPRPLVVFLHGAGERGYDNIQQLRNFPQQMTSPQRSRAFPCYILAPQCPGESHWGNWMPELEAMIEQVVREYPVDRSRIYLTGLSMGGFGSWEFAARRPDLFAAVVPVCGGGNQEWAASLKDLPIWAVHGGADTVVPPEQSRKMVDALRAAGGNPIYTELPGVGHDSWSHAYSDSAGIVDWMFRQTNTPASVKPNAVSAPTDPAVTDSFPQSP